MFLIVGLGNPGKEYELSRHNIGFRVIDRLSKNLDIKVSKGLCQAITGQATVAGHKVILAKPQTFMNLSGDSVLELVRWFKIDTDHLIAIHDDLDLETGKLRIRPKGNSAGHKGVESIISRLGTTEFVHVRIGIGKPAGNLEEDTSKYVLSGVPKEEAEVIDQAILWAAEAAETVVKDGLEAAMNKYNTQ